MKDLPSIYTEIPTDRAKKIEAAKEFFSNLIKQVPPESYKKFKIDYDEKNNINIMKQMKTTNQYNEINNRIQNLFRNLQKDPKTIFHSVSNLSRTLLNKARKSTYTKDNVFVNLYNQLEDKNFYQKNNNLPLVTLFVNKKVMSIVQLFTV